jgi:RNA recognition motif-containing protein
MEFSSARGDPRLLFVADIPPGARMSEALRAFERYGPVTRLSFVTAHHGPPLGHAFLSFATATSGELCLDRARRAASDPHAIPVAISGSPVGVALQSCKDELIRAPQRHLELAAEGLSGAGLPERDAISRRRMLQDKEAKLRDPQYSVSPCRLIVSNLPPGVPASEIRRLFADAPGKWARANRAQELAAKLRGVPRIRDVARRPGREDSVLVEFAQEAHALAAVREVSGNPAYFAGRRLIVEFAVERGAGGGAGPQERQIRAMRFAGTEPAPREVSAFG